MVPAEAPDDARRSGSPRSCTATRWSPATSSCATKIRRADGAADARPARRQGGVLRCLVPRRLRDLPAAPADLAAAATPSPTTSPHGGDPGHPRPWDAVDLRRLRCGDPAADALAEAFGRREIACGWTLNLEQEDVCPVVTLPDRRVDRRRPRRPGQEGAPRDPAQGQAGGGCGRRPRSTTSWTRSRPAGVHRPPPAALGRPRPVPVDARRRPEPRVHPAAVRAVRRRAGRCGSRSSRSAAGGSRPGSRSRPPDAILYYNAGVDPDARDLSPGVLHGRALRAARARARDRAAGHAPRRRAVQVRVGRGRRADPAPARPTDGRPMTPPPGFDPCLAPCAGAAGRRPSGSASSRCSRRAPTAAPRSTSTTSSRGWTRRGTTCRSCRCRRAAPCASSSGSASR